MHRTRCLVSTATATALHRVFIAPVEQSQFQLLSRSQAPKLLCHLARQTRQLPQPQRQQHRSVVTSAAPDKRRPPRDHEIKAWSVTLVGADGKLSDTINTSHVLAGLDKDKQSLVVVVPGEPGVPPICKIMDRQLMREAEKAKTKAARNPAATVKTIELNWAIDANDLGHRLNKMKGFLAKGNKVEVLLAGKKKGRKATGEEALAVLARLKAAVEEVDGAKESKAMEGKVLGTAKYFAEGKAPK